MHHQNDSIFPKALDYNVYVLFVFQVTDPKSCIIILYYAEWNSAVIDSYNFSVQ